MRILATLACPLIILFSSFTAQAVTPTPASLAITQIPDNQYVTLTFHDIRDDVVTDLDRDPYAINTQNLAQLFDWMQRHQWHPISLQQIIDAKQGKTKLPKNAVLLTFDDGAASHYDKLFPLLKAYEYPAVLALVTSWLKTDYPVSSMPSETYSYNALLTWQQAKEMQQSGLVEFATHTDRLHQGILANPQGNNEPAALTKKYNAPQKKYETEQEFVARIKADLNNSASTLYQYLGVRPRAVVWPYGAASEQLQQIAESVDMPLSFGLSGKVSHINTKGVIDRLLILNDPSPTQINGSVESALQPKPGLNNAIYLNLDTIYSADQQQLEKNLDQLLERIKALKVRTVYLQGYADTNHNGSADALYFPNHYLPMRADLFNRVAWQLRTRAFVRVYAAMPLISYELPDSAQQQQFAIKATGSPLNQIMTNPRLSPFLPQSQTIVAGIMTDLAHNFSALDGILIGANAYILDHESSQSCDSTARWPLSQGVVSSCDKLDDFQRQQALSQFAQVVTRPMATRVNQSNSFKVARELGLPLYGKVPDSQSNIADIDALLKQFDEVMLSLPLLDNSSREQQQLTNLTQMVKTIPNALSRVIFNIRTTAIYPQSANALALSSVEKDRKLQQQLIFLARNKVTNLSYMPESFLQETKRFATLYQGISLNAYPYFYHEPNLEEAAP